MLRHSDIYSTVDPLQAWPVTLFGAVADGATNLTTAINEAVSYGGKRLFVPDGTYALTSVLNITQPLTLLLGDVTIICNIPDPGANSGAIRIQSSGVAIKGLSQSRSKIQVQSGGPISSICVFNVSDVTLEDFTFDCNQTVSGIRIGTTDAATADMRNIHIRRVKVVSSGNMSAPATTFRHNFEIKKGITLVDTAYGIKDVWIEDCIGENAAGDGIFGGDNLSIASYNDDGNGTVEDIHVRGCRFSRAGRQNISVEGLGSTRPNRIFIEDCTLEDSSLAGIDIEEANQVSLNGIIFLRSGTYTTYTRNVGINAASEMFAGLVLHGTDKQLACSNLIFDSCFYGLSGYLHVKMSDCKFINSYIFNGLASTAGRWEFVNCEFSGSGSLPLIKMTYPTATFSACKFTYTGSATHMIWLQGDSLFWGEVLFQGCIFEGSGNTLDAISLQQIRSVRIADTAFKNFRRVITDTSTFGDIVVAVQNCNIRTVDAIAVFGFRNLQDLVFIGNWCDEVKGGFTVNTGTRMLICDNIFNIRMNTGDGLSHTFISTTPVIDLKISGNVATMVGTAADTRFLTATSKDDDYTPRGPHITNNTIVSFLNGLNLLLDSGYEYRGCKVTGNHFQGVTTALEAITGAHTATYIQTGNSSGDSAL